MLPNSAAIPLNAQIVTILGMDLKRLSKSCRVGGYARGSGECQSNPNATLLGRLEPRATET